MQNYSNANRHRRGKPKYSPRPKQRRKAYIAPEPPKPCVVRYLPTGYVTTYQKEEKQLTVRIDGHTEFPSKRKAQKAIWHTVQASGKPGSHVDYRIEEL